MVRKSDGILNQPQKRSQISACPQTKYCGQADILYTNKQETDPKYNSPSKQGGTYAELAPKKQRQAIHNLVLSFYPDNRCTDYCRNTADNRFSRVRILHMPETAPNHSFYRTVLISYIRSCVLDHFRAFMEYLIQIRSINTPY